MQVRQGFQIFGIGKKGNKFREVFFSEDKFGEGFAATLRDAGGSDRLLNFVKVVERRRVQGKGGRYAIERIIGEAVI